MAHLWIKKDGLSNPNPLSWRHGIIMWTISLRLQTSKNMVSGCCGYSADSLSTIKSLDRSHKEAIPKVKTIFLIISHFCLLPTKIFDFYTGYA